MTDGAGVLQEWREHTFRDHKGCLVCEALRRQSQAAQAALPPPGDAVEVGAPTAPAVPGFQPHRDAKGRITSHPQREQIIAILTKHKACRSEREIAAALDVYEAARREGD